MNVPFGNIDIYTIWEAMSFPRIKKNNNYLQMVGWT